MAQCPPRVTLFPYTTLFRSLARGVRGDERSAAADRLPADHAAAREAGDLRRRVDHDGAGARDRKSTRLNSSHITISYAVCCLKKKNKAKARKQAAALAIVVL